MDSLFIVKNCPTRGQLIEQLDHVKRNTPEADRPVVSFEFETIFKRTAVVSGFTVVAVEHGNEWYVEGYLPEGASLFVDGITVEQPVRASFIAPLMKFKGILNMETGGGVLESRS